MLFRFANGWTFNPLLSIGMMLSGLLFARLTEINSLEYISGTCQEFYGDILTPEYIRSRRKDLRRLHGLPPKDPRVSRSIFSWTQYAWSCNYEGWPVEKKNTLSRNHPWYKMELRLASSRCWTSCQNQSAKTRWDGVFAHFMLSPNEYPDTVWWTDMHGHVISVAHVLNPCWNHKIIWHCHHHHGHCRYSCRPPVTPISSLWLAT